MNHVTSSLLSFMATAAIMPVVIRVAKACNCLDVPGGRRGHGKVTPRWGGVGFFAGVLPFLLLQNEGDTLTSFIAASCLLVSMGAIDDLRPLGWKTKFCGMVAAATIVIFGGGIQVLQIGSYGSFGFVKLGWLSIPFTYLCIVGVTNAINLLDGLNGLAGGSSLLGFLFLGCAAILSGNMTIAAVCIAFAGALAAFLLFNFPTAKVFMGDSGSTLLGFSLSFVAMSLTQGPTPSIDAMFPVLVLLIPIFDTLRVFFFRVVNGKHPFRADRSHLHYLMLEHFSPVKVTLLIWLLSATLGGIAFCLPTSTSLPYLVVVISASLLLGLFAEGLSRSKQPQTTVGAFVVPSGMEADVVDNFRSGSGSGVSSTGGMMIKWMVGLGIMLIAAQVGAEDTLPLKTQSDRVNYAIGVNFIGNLKQQGIEIDADLVSVVKRLPSGPTRR